MTNDERTRAAIELGNRLAEETLARRRAARATRAAALAAYQVDSAAPADLRSPDMVNHATAGRLVALIRLEGAQVKPVRVINQS